ncbi:MAG TPA: recombinase family protein [Thermoplasmata archaeon]|nr:recombinase family protein [Thermoplasmata archaeon]
MGSPRTGSDRGLSPANVIAVAYLRVSTEDQAREGFSLDAQRARIRAYCSARGYDLFEEFVDEGASGRTTNRPAFRAMMAAVRDGLPVEGRVVRIGAVVVAKFDRLNRNLYDFLATQREMQRHEVAFASVDETVDTRGPFGRFFVQVIAAFAELESGIIGERVRHGMRQKAIQGGFNGMSAPFGYVVQRGGLVVNNREAVVVRQICFWKRAGKSLAWIANRLNEDGTQTKKGKRWSKRQVFRVVHNPVYRGALHWEDVVTPGAHEAIVRWTPRRRGARPSGA